MLGRAELDTSEQMAKHIMDVSCRMAWAWENLARCGTGSRGAFALCTNNVALKIQYCRQLLYYGRY